MGEWVHWVLLVPRSDLEVESMSMSIFSTRDVGRGTPAGSGHAELEAQQAALLEMLYEADGAPLSYAELQEAGIELPASVVSELELAGVPIVRCLLGGARGVGVRLLRHFDAQSILNPPVAQKAPRHAWSGAARKQRWAGIESTFSEGVRRGWQVVLAVAAWVVRVVPPATQAAVKRLSDAGRLAGERGWGGVRRGWQVVLAVAAWVVRVVPPATQAAVKRLSDTGRAAVDLTRRSWSAEYRPLQEQPNTRLTQTDTVAPSFPLLDPAERQHVNQARVRWVAFGALTAVGGVVFALVLIALASGGQTGRHLAHHHNLRHPLSAATASGLQKARPARRQAPIAVSGAAARELEARGHQMLLAGRYGEAVQILPRAVAASGERAESCVQPVSETCLTYTYALYDLGRALLLDGQSAASIPVLERRLQIDNQRTAVQAELELARAQARRS
jgi:hypothetical protein